MNHKRCRHLLNEGECWLCNGNARSPDARSYAESIYHKDLIETFIKNEQIIFVNEELWDNITTHEGNGDA